MSPYFTIFNKSKGWYSEQHELISYNIQIQTLVIDDWYHNTQMEGGKLLRLVSFYLCLGLNCSKSTYTYTKLSQGQIISDSIRLAAFSALGRVIGQKVCKIQLSLVVIDRIVLTSSLPLIPMHHLLPIPTLYYHYHCMSLSNTVEGRNRTFDWWEYILRWHSIDVIEIGFQSSKLT